MKISLDTKYEVYDKKSRYWGNVVFNHIEEKAESYSVFLSGNLSPSSDFELLESLFKKHDNSMKLLGSCDDKDTTETALEIASLGVKLVNPINKNEYRVYPVFVCEKCSFTCYYETI